MTNQNSAAQAAMGTVSDADLLRICQQFNPGQDLDLAKAVRAEVLSQLRCPVADIRIGVSASGQGATICIMQPYADGSTTTIYSEMHPLGDSMGRATWWAPESANAPKTTQEYKLRAMARNYTDRHSWDHLDSDCVMAAADEIRALRAALASALYPGR